MTKEREALKMALEALDQSATTYFDKRAEAITAIQEALAQSEHSENDDDLILVPRILIGAACCAIDKKRDAPETLEKLRGYSMGAQAEQEPVARIGMIDEQHFADVCRKAGGNSNTPLYTAPPKREWVSLTDGKIDAVTDVQWGEMSGQPLAAHRAYARAIEAKLKELNT